MNEAADPGGIKFAVLKGSELLKDMTTTKTKWKHWHTWAILVCIAMIIIISLIPRKVSDSDTTDMQPKADTVL